MGGKGLSGYIHPIKRYGTLVLIHLAMLLCSFSGVKLQETLRTATWFALFVLKGYLLDKWETVRPGAGELIVELIFLQFSILSLISFTEEGIIQKSC